MAVVDIPVQNSLGRNCWIESNTIKPICCCITDAISCRNNGDRGWTSNYVNLITLSKSTAAASFQSRTICSSQCRYGSPQMCNLLGNTASSMQHPIWLLWDDPTWVSLIFSPLLERILADAIPVDLRDTCDFLRKRPLSWHPKFLLLSKDLWALKGYFINANGLNNVTQPALYCFSNNFHYVGLQKTRFTRIKTFQRAKHLWHKPPPAKHQFLISISHGLFHWIAVSVCLSRRLVRFANYGTSLFPAQALQIQEHSGLFYV